ncbi:MAG: protein kinase [Agarilytica sp.]
MSEDDKTRIKFPNTSNTEDENLTSENAAGDASEETLEAKEQREKVEAKRKTIAEKKARELEKRLAAISAKKKARPSQKPIEKHRSPEIDGQISEHSESDKTQIDSRRQLPASDKTQIQPRGSLSSPDKTQIKLRGSSLQAASDSTVFQPKKQGAPGDAVSPTDETTLNELLVSAPKNSGGLEVDRSEYLKSGHELLKNRFVFEEVLGAGGMGVVYKAKDLLKVEAQDKDPYVAIKVLSDDFKTHPEAFIALQRESRKTQRIAHPNIVNVHDFDRDGETVFMTMEYLDGKPLDVLISQYKTTGLPEEDAWKILEGISAALIYAHGQKIIHSDFKPGNIFVTNQNNAKVFDFGIARAVAKAEVHEETADDKTVFDAGNLGALTPAYASLEMLEGKVPDVRDDIYALGCIAYEMFTGMHPYNRVHADEAKRKKLKPKRIPNISKRQWKVIESALAFKREDRVATVSEFWECLNKKRGTGVIVAGVVLVLVTVISVLAYQNYLAPKENNFSEDEIRSEIERKVFIEQNKLALEELLTSREFTESWERKIASTYSSLEKLLGAEDVWLLEQRQRVFQVYFDHIVSLIAKEEFEQARKFVESARGFTNDDTKLTAILSQIDEAEALVAKRIEQEKIDKRKAESNQKALAQTKKAQKERNVAFDVALATVNKQLQCRSSMNMRDIDIAIGKLRSLNPSRYRKAEKDIVSALAACISKIGRSFPERAEEFKKRALRTFPKNTIISRLKIEPKDPCDTALAGLGARGSRAICRDILKSEGESFGKGPSLVVIPAKGSLETFAIGKFEITIDDFNKFCEHSGNCDVRSADNSRLPVTQVDEALIDQYLNWLSRKSKRKYRLPTKAEWMYAARAGSAKLDSNRNCRLDSRGIKKGGVLIKASSGQQNAWGLINYLGNARELVRDRDGSFALGGSYETAIEECVVTKSVSHTGKGDKYTGFRLLREIDSKK